MFSIKRSLVILGLSALVSQWLVSSLEARVWKDQSGVYSIEADLVGFDEKTVILQRTNKELGACEISKLCEADREFLETKQALEIHDSNLQKVQSWKLVNGLHMIGKIADYAKRDLTIQRRRGKVYVNDKAYAALPPVYQKMLLAIVSEEEQQEIGTESELNAWVLTLRGDPKEYHLEGVVMELENGDEHSIPFFMFVDQDREILHGGFDEWLAHHGDVMEDDEVPQFTKPNEHQIMLQSLAATYHHDQQVNQQIALMNLQLQQVQAGITSPWEVTLYPGPGNRNPPRWVVVYARDSQVATNLAIQQNPGFVVGPIRRLN